MLKLVYNCFYVDFDIQFNPDIFVAGIKAVDTPEQLERDRKMAIDATGYLTESIIPKFVSPNIKVLVHV